MKKNFKFIALFIVSVLLITGCGKGENSSNSKVNLSAPDGVKAETFYSIDNSNLIVKITNESSSDINALYVVADYPGDNNLITTDSMVVQNIKANSTTFASLLLPIDNDFNSYVPDSFDLTVLDNGEYLEGIEDTSMYADKVKASYDVEDNTIYFSLTNDSGKILGGVDAVIVYYKDGKPIATDSVNSLNVGDSYQVERDVIYTGDFDDPKYIDYDNIEVYITSINDDYVESIPEEGDGSLLPDDGIIIDEDDEGDIEEDFDEEDEEE